MENILLEKEQHLNYFCVEAAVKYGVCEAVVLQSFAFWLQKNLKEGRNHHDGQVWTFNSLEAMLKYFPYFTYNQLRRIINKLKEAGLIKIFNYNKMAYDKTRWFSFTELGEKLLGICVRYEEESEAELTNAVVQNNKSICENSQMEDEKTTNDVAECTDGSVEKHKPIPFIETNIEKTDIEKSVIESSEGGDVAAITKPVSLSFVSEARFQKLYKDIEEELFSKGDAVDMENIFTEVPEDGRYEAIIAEIERRLAQEKEGHCKHNQRLLEKAYNNREAMAVVAKYYGKDQQIDDIDSLGRLYAQIGYYFFDLTVRVSHSCGIADGRAIYEFGISMENERRKKKAQRQGQYRKYQDARLEHSEFEEF